jgi:hypothetical protein
MFPETCPSPFSPWHEAQETANNALPWATCWLVPVSAADFVLGARVE